MSMTITPIEHTTCGAIVTGLDLGALTADEWQQFYAAFLHYGVLVCPGQHLDDSAQGRFAAQFGETEQLGPKQKGPNVPIANTRQDGKLAQPGDEQYKLLRGNEGWHTDSTYMPLASKVAMLSALEIPPQDGETEFADMRAAWEALAPELQIQLDGLSANHSLYYSQMRAGYDHTTDNIYGFHDKGAPRRPIIKTHPETGRKSIYTGRHAYGLDGMDDAASTTLLDELLTNACQPPRVYTHRWQVGDLVVWDNRCMMHRARPYDPAHRRVLRGTRISGDPATELAPTHADARAAAFNPSDNNRSARA